MFHNATSDLQDQDRFFGSQTGLVLRPSFSDHITAGNKLQQTKWRCLSIQRIPVPPKYKMQDHQHTTHLSSTPVFLSISQRRSAKYAAYYSASKSHVATIIPYYTSDLVCQSLETSCVIDAYLCLAVLHAWILEYQHMMLCVWWWIPMKAEGQRPAGEDHRAAVATSGSTRSRRMPTPYRYLRCGDLRSPAVMEGRNGPLGLRDDDHDDISLVHWHTKIRDSFKKQRYTTWQQNSKHVRQYDTIQYNWVTSVCRQRRTAH